MSFLVHCLELLGNTSSFKGFSRVSFHSTLYIPSPDCDRNRSVVELTVNANANNILYYYLSIYQDDNIILQVVRMRGRAGET